MTEKRSDYRKRQNHHNDFLHKVKSAFSDDNNDTEEIDVNPDFRREQPIRRPLPDDGKETFAPKNDLGERPKIDKGLRLKRRLNRAILIVFVLIVLVLLALFHL